MTMREQPQDKALEAFFQAGRRGDPAPSDDLVARVLEDATQVSRRAACPRGLWSWLAGVVAPVGGWPGVAGLSVATCAGLWIGVSPPDGWAARGDAVLGLDGAASMAIDAAPETLWPGLSFDEGAL